MTELKNYLEKWNLFSPKKIDVHSAASDVYIVTMQDGRKAVLKLLKGDGIRDEQMGAIALNHFNGHGAVRVLAYDEGAQLLEHIDGDMLRTLVDNNQDEEAACVIVDLIKSIHGIATPPPKGLRSLKDNFKELYECTSNIEADPHYKIAANIADELFATTEREVVLHGDIHHENILGSPITNQWVLIDPKGLIGDPCYDLANTFNNPPGRLDLVRDINRIERMATIFSEKLCYDKKRILKFVTAYMALSSAWHYCSGNFEDAKVGLQNSKIVYKNFIA